MIQTLNLTKKFGTITAVDHISLQIEKGDMFGLVGPDGAGKTTFIRLLCGLLLPTSGQALVIGFDTVSQLAKIKGRIGYLSQRFSLYGDLSVIENLNFFADIHIVPQKTKEERIKRLLAFSRLEPFVKRQADYLSGGMKQKLALCCALIHQPELLLLDEPTTGVDPVSRQEFWLILKDLNQQGMTILVSTPYMDEAEKCHHVGFIHLGQLIACDTPTALLTAIKNPLFEVYCQSCFEASLFLKSLPSVLDAQAFGDRVHVLLRERDEQLADKLADHGFAVSSIRQISPSMEDLFVYLLRERKQEK